MVNQMVNQMVTTMSEHPSLTLHGILREFRQPGCNGTQRALAAEVLRLRVQLNEVLHASLQLPLTSEHDATPE
jgi:hypothetical protein